MRHFLVALAAFLCAGVALAKPEGARAVCLNDAGALPAAEARLLAIGSYKAPRVSADDRAQKFFEQGMVFGLGFNFAEAVRSFCAATLAGAKIIPRPKVSTIRGPITCQKLTWRFIRTIQ